MLVSFDIFDSALIRRCGKAENIFWILAQRLYPNDEAMQEDFFLWRRQVEKISHGINLTDFYKNANRLFRPYSEEELCFAELAVEEEQLTANTSIRENIQHHRSIGDTICFISDMYLPSDFLKKILRREKCLADEDQVFVSCEWNNARKDTGELYEVVQKEMSPTQWLHYGDNLHSDIRMAKLHGIKTKKVNTAWNPVEIFLLAASRYLRHPQHLSILVGVSRNNRLRHFNQPEHILAANYVAPAYIPYVHWLLSRSQKEEIQRLYFLSRDGWILRNIAEKMETQIECKDLFVSRKALALPWLYTHFDREAFLRLLDGHTLLGRKLDDVLSLLKVRLDDLRNFGISYNHERIASHEEESSFLSQLFSGQCGNHLKKIAASARKRLLGYLRQEGVGQVNVNSAFVDIGWVGTSRLMLNDILREEGLTLLPTFYFSVRHDCYPCAYGKYEAFFPEGTLSTDLTTVVENYFSASVYPSTLDYIEQNGQWKPDWVFKYTSVINPLASVNCDVACMMACEVVKYPLDGEALFTWARITLDEVLALKQPVNLSPLVKLTDFDGVDFVRRLSIVEVFRLVCLGKHITAWDNASLTLTVGYRLKSLLWPIHIFVAAKRRMLYHFFLRLFT